MGMKKRPALHKALNRNVTSGICCFCELSLSVNRGFCLFPSCLEIKACRKIGKG